MAFGVPVLDLPPFFFPFPPFFFDEEDGVEGMVADTKEKQSPHTQMLHNDCGKSRHLFIGGRWLIADRQTDTDRHRHTQTHTHTHKEKAKVHQA